LGNLADALPPQLSGGERQRAALARAVIMGPDVILADEPTGNLDWEMSLRLLTLLVELNRMGKTVLVATHDLNLIRTAKAQVAGARAAHREPPGAACGGRSVTTLPAPLPGHARRGRPTAWCRPGHTAWLTTFTAAAMAFLAVFALALSLASGRLADRWGDALAAPPPSASRRPRSDRRADPRGARPAGHHARHRIARALSEDEQRALLEPWFGPDLPLDPAHPAADRGTDRGTPGYDGEGLRLRLAAEAPGAVLDDHTRWRRPLAEAAGRLRLLGGVSPWC
jgi:hypothetical protein